MAEGIGTQAVKSPPRNKGVHIRFNEEEWSCVEHLVGDNAASWMRNAVLEHQGLRESLAKYYDDIGALEKKVEELKCNLGVTREMHEKACERRRTALEERNEARGEVKALKEVVGNLEKFRVSLESFKSADDNMHNAMVLERDELMRKNVELQKALEVARSDRAYAIEDKERFEGTVAETFTSVKNMSSTVMGTYSLIVRLVENIEKIQGFWGRLNLRMSSKSWLDIVKKGM